MSVVDGLPSYGSGRSDRPGDNTRRARIVLINPNTTVAMTRAMMPSARDAVARAEVLGVTSSMGPPSIEGHYDEALSVPGLLQAITADPTADAFVIACFGDPGLEAARELATVPVLGIAEAAMKTATLLGNSFSVVTSLARTIGRARSLARTYGLERQCAGVWACEMEVLSLDADREQTFQRVLSSSQNALRVDGSDSIVLGCAGMAWLPARLTAALGVPVIDGVGAATAMAEALIRLALRPASHGELARPIAKQYIGVLAPFSPPGSAHVD